jgi:hypothetical protein
MVIRNVTLHSYFAIRKTVESVYRPLGDSRITLTRHVLIKKKEIWNGRKSIDRRSAKVHGMPLV